jgi:HPt (histidine-containing phosphotransfer) domain-containing protein
MDKWPNAPVIMEELMEDFSGDLSAIKGLFDDLILNINDQLGIIEEAIRNKDFEILTKEVHRIKGAASNLRVVYLSKACLEFEEKAKTNNIAGCTESFAKMKEEFIRFAQFSEGL